MKDLLWPLRIHQNFPGNWRMPLGAYFTQDGTFHLDVPGVLRRGPEIGSYVHDLGPARVRAFRALIEQQKIWDTPDLKVLKPEQHTVHVMVGEYRGPHRAVTWPIGDLPPEALPVMDTFNKLIDEAYASPREVLSGEARWRAPTTSAREPLAFEFTLRNKGRDPITVHSPTSSSGDLTIQLLVSPSAPPAAERSSPQWVDITPTALEWVDPPRRHGTGKEKPLELAPGQSLRLAATSSVYLSPGEHRAVLHLDFGDPGNGSGNLIYGILAIDLPPLHVVPG